jgi:hypothetical protein
VSVLLRQASGLEGLCLVSEPSEPNRLAVSHREDMPEALVERDAASPSPSLNVQKDDHVITGLCDALKLDAGDFKAVEDPLERDLEAVFSVPHPGLECVIRIVPFDLGIEALEQVRPVASAEVRIGHTNGVEVLRHRPASISQFQEDSA